MKCSRRKSIHVLGSFVCLFSRASLHANIPSLCGILVYKDVTSIMTRKDSGGITPRSLSFCRKWLVSLI